MSAEIRPAGEAALLLEYGCTIDPKTNLRVIRAARRIAEDGPDGIEDVIPAYTTVLVSFDPARVSPGEIRSFVREDPEVWDPPASGEEQGDVHRIPVAYGGDEGPDLEDVALRCGLSPAEVIEIHTGDVYRVYFLGFTPGYPYMGELDPKIEVPRRPSPRTRVPAGSVAIAGRQTGLYPMATPGGWSLLGRTPVRLFDPSSEDPTLLRPGDRVEFYPIEGPVEAPGVGLLEFEPGRPICKVLQPGLYTTLQDDGRRGYMHLGASRAGAADLHSLHRANVLVGNAPGAAALEMTALGPHLEFLRESTVAVAGAQTTLLVDGSPVKARNATRIPAGSRVSFGPF
ncbi:MAG: 5-oxoprolinase subunit PxpB, partial [Bacillota bacterium]